MSEVLVNTGAPHSFLVAGDAVENLTPLEVRQNSCTMTTPKLQPGGVVGVGVSLILCLRKGETLTHITKAKQSIALGGLSCGSPLHLAGSGYRRHLVPLLALVALLFCRCVWGDFNTILLRFYCFVDGAAGQRLGL